MSDDSLLWTAKPSAPRVPRPGELLFEFTRPSDGAPMCVELRFHGKSFGWEATFLIRGELFSSHGAFATRAAAIKWAEEERKTVEKGDAEG